MKIGFCGTQSVGKSTLVNKLKEENIFGDYSFFTERSKELKEKGIPLNKESTLKGQLVFLNERLNELMEENIVTDRTLIDVLSFTLLSPHINDEDKQIFKNITRNLIHKYDTIIYIPIVDEISMEDNGIRETDLTFRKQIDNQILQIIKEFELNNVVFLKEIDLERRVTFIKKIMGGF